MTCIIHSLRASVDNSVWLPETGDPLEDFAGVQVIEAAPADSGTQEYMRVRALEYFDALKLRFPTASIEVTIVSDGSKE